MRYTYQHGDQLYTIDLEPQADGSYHAITGDESYHVQVSAGADGGLLIDVDGQRSLAHAAVHNSQRYVHVDGRTYALSLPEARASWRRSGGGSGGLNAQMPGQVIEVLVAEGDVVASGQALVILEAMKMEIRVAAPADGVVKQLCVAVGDVVDRGQLLVELGGAE